MAIVKLSTWQHYIAAAILIHLCLQAVDCGLISEQGERIACVSPTLIKRYNLNTQLYQYCDHLARNVSTAQQRRLRRDIKPIFAGHPKPRGEVLANKFHMSISNSDQTDSLVRLINKIASEYLYKCPPVIYYDSFVEKSDNMILASLFKTFPISFYHGEINKNYQAINPRLKRHNDNQCKSYILFLSDPQMTRKIIGPQIESRVVLIARSSQWKLRDFLASEPSSNIVNLLVIRESLTEDQMGERPYVLYTHKLYTDGLGSNTPIVLTSWMRGALSRPHVSLFPPKFSKGFAGHSFQVTTANQPPFIFRIQKLSSGGTTSTNWDGVEYRLLNLIASKLNFTLDIIEAPNRADSNSVSDNIELQIARRAADIGMCGLYITEERLTETDMSIGHSRDCASFITLASKALPKYRAIMGPFQWPVWVCIVIIYLGAIFPIVYSDRLTLRHLIGNWGEMENMFWYVFGMFTNSLTFSGKYSWANTQKTSTRVLIGSYWLFTIIITACYTGSIIAFVTLPAFPNTVDSVNDLLGLFFRVGTLDNSGWETWFQNSTHVQTAKLYRKMEFVSTLEEGIGNVTQSFFWNYAFLGSAAQLEFMVQKNFTDENISRRSALHLSEECFALFQVGFLYPRDSVYKRKIDSMILLAQQSGLMSKILNEVRWSMQRSASGKLLQASSSNALRERIQEERQLTTADTEGMFLLMGIGYLLGAVALISEIVGGITNKCRQIIRRSRKSISSAWSSRRTSVDDENALHRTAAEQVAHEYRKAARRKAEKECADRQGFGVREFNLTKKTLKELYGSYYKKEPSYVLKDGKLLLETEEISASSADCNSRESSGDIPAALILPLHSKKQAMMVAEVDVEREKKKERDLMAAAAEESLAALDECMKMQHCEDSSASSDDDADVADEYELFGSFVVPEGSLAAKLNDLNLFNDAEVVLKNFDDEQKVDCGNS
ncbi:PREDICTED: ionotropic receptor 21a [Rhagoletis zephyria]|uniref:ionotropic receptor 21a n=1 Tax=Rhagoletis zephyria TaxID=28612 RepID=UPI0008114346|nr:PREDICTED: ionotropic receptor 21a [Rhagoletis zephyria]